MIEESLGEVTGRLDEVEGRVGDLESLAGDIDSRLTDVEVAITEKATLEDVQSMIEESLGEVTGRLDEVEGRVGDLESLAGDLDSRLSDVEVALVEKASLEELEELQKQVSELSDRISKLEIPAEFEEFVGRIETVEIMVEDLYSLIDEFSTSFTELSDKVSGIETAISGVEDRISNIEKKVDKFAISGSTSVTVKKEFGVTKNITLDDSTTLNLSFKPSDGVNISTSITLKGITYTISTSLNKLSVSVAQTDLGLKNLTLTYDHTADSNFAVDIYGLVGSKTAKFVASSELLGVKASVGVNGSADGTGEDLIAGKVYGSMSNINYNIFGSIGRTTTTATYVLTLGADFDTTVAKGIKLFGEALYDGTFDVLGGVEATNLVPNLYTLAKATYQDDKLGLYAKASYPVSPQAKVTGEVTVSDVTQTPGVTLKGSVEGKVDPFSYSAWLQADLKANIYSGYALVSAVIDPYSFKVEADIPDLTKLTDPNSTKLTVEGSYKLTPNIKLTALVSTYDPDTPEYTALGKVSADLVLAPNVSVNFTVLKKALGTITTEPTKNLSASLTTSVSF
jgi:predicted  nucleic acid-binding Zn-ribbon protein